MVCVDLKTCGVGQASLKIDAEVRRPEAESRTPTSGFLTQGVQDGGAADGEADHGSQRGDEQEVGAEVEEVGEDGGDREDQSHYIEPERGADRRGQVFAETQLQEQSGESDGSDDDKGERAEERGAAGVDHHQSQCEKEQTGSHDAPAAGLGRGNRVGSGVGQGLPFQVIQGGSRVFK